MRKIVRYALLSILSVLFYFFSFSQVPGVKWQRSLGGLSEDAYYEDTSINLIKKTPIVVNNRGYVIATTSSSNSGDVSGNQGSSDFWIVRMDTARNIVWQTSYGGSADERANEIQPTSDSLYIAGGIAYSTNGHVSGRRDVNQGDGWLIQISPYGELMWQKCLGGTGRDEIISVKPAADGGFILLGNTMSNDVDVSGNHGLQDIWLVKVNSLGDILWQKTLGGSNYDYAGDLLVTSDGNYLVAGATESTDGDVTGHHERKDMWIVKLNNAGDIIWQKCFGGSLDEGAASIKETADGGYIAAGFTFSTDGDVTLNKGYCDIWVVIMNANGDLVWQQSFGGTNAEKAGEVQRTPDNGFIICGSTWSNDGDVSGNHGTRDSWVVKLDNVGNIQWQKCFGGTNQDGGYGIVPVGEKEYLMTGSVRSDNGDVLGFHGGSDFWLARLGASNTIKGIVYLDENSNGIRDAGENLTNEVRLTLSGAGAEYTILPFEGTFNFQVDAGSFTTTATPVLPYFTTVPSSVPSVFNTYFNTDSFSFALQPLPGTRDLFVSLVPTGAARPGFNTTYQLIYKNLGTQTISSGTVRLIKDSRTDFITASVAPGIIKDDTLTWNYVDLGPYDQVSLSITLRLKPPPTTNFGDVLEHTAIIDPVDGDFAPADNTFVLKELVRGSYDPNDKIESNNGVITESQIANGEYLNYMIRFQNVGTDTAFNIVIRDTLQNKVDWSTLQMVSSSHDYQFTITDGNKCTWTFNDIKLPDHIVNEPASHGYVAYRIKPLSTVVVGDIVYNDASIYFDNNLPVATNLHETLVDNLTPLPVLLLDFTAKLNDDGTVLLSWETASEENADFFEIERSNGTGFTVLQKVAATNAAQGAVYSAEDRKPFEGKSYYRLRMVDIDGTSRYSRVVQVRSDESKVIVQLNPNPNYGELDIKLAGPLNGFVNISIYDMTGKKIHNKAGGFVSGNSYNIPVQLSGVSPGIYIATIQAGSFIKQCKFVVRSK